MKLALVGYGQSGKDTAGEWLGANTSLVYSPDWSPTSKVIFRHLREEPEFAGMTDEEIYQSRLTNRQKWYEVGNMLRAHDPTYLVRECLSNSDIVTGIRDGFELEACRSILDVIVWIDRTVKVDPTVKFSPEDADLIISNQTTLEEFHDRLYIFARNCKILEGPRRRVKSGRGFPLPPLTPEEDGW